MPDDSQLHEKIGFMRADIKNLGEKVDSICKSVDQIGKTLPVLRETTVKQQECTARVRMISDKFGEIKDMLAKKQTRQDHPAVSVPNTMPSIPVLTESGKFRSIRKSLKENIALVIMILTLAGILVAGTVKLARFIVTMEDLMKKRESDAVSQFSKMRKEIKSMEPKVVYVPIHPDAGPAPKKARTRSRGR